ncbi:MAG TPA: LLM class flavin-dependent oxidoreductase [Dehalococcoidia bacterium]|nr:LLM class flavin-dependent oxidoreductase [Dehalococcoidia bacterium]
MTNARMKFGVFLAPFHRLGENPTLALERDMELLEWLDRLDYDEAWIGEHHSAGWETIASPEVFIAAAAQRTRRIMLGTGVVSLPYHHPFLVADRFVLLDHLTRGRAMLGVGPGALPSDAYMMGIDPMTQRQKMDESLGVIMHLLTNTEPLTVESDWFTLKEARLQLRPYTRPHPPMAVANTFSPSGMKAAGKHGIGVLSIGTFQPNGLIELPKQWQWYEDAARENNQPIQRHEWRLMMPIYLAESRKDAFSDIKDGGTAWMVDYFEKTLGRPVQEATADPIRSMADRGGAIIGTPDDAIRQIQDIQQISGGFGGLLGLAHEWAPREKILHSYELFARYVAPHFQDSLVGLVDSQRWNEENKTTIFGSLPIAIAKAFNDAGEQLPEVFTAAAATPGTAGTAAPPKESSKKERRPRARP